MKRERRIFLAFVLGLTFSTASCTDDKAQDSGGGIDDSDHGDDTSDSDDDTAIVYPSGERVLLFYGHGGAVAEGNGWGRFEDIATHWQKNFGWETDWSSTLSGDILSYRLIAFLGQGLDGGSEFDAATVEKFQSAMEAGARILILTEVDNCGSEILNKLMADLGVSLRLNGDGAQEYRVVEASRIVNHQSTDTVVALEFSDPCYVDPGSGQGLVFDSENAMVAAERPGHGGEVMVVGDFEFLDDSGSMKEADNLAFADQLAMVSLGVR